MINGEDWAADGSVGLGIPGTDLARAAGHLEQDDRLIFWPELAALPSPLGSSFQEPRQAQAGDAG